MAATNIVTQVTKEAGLDIDQTEHWSEIIDLSTKLMTIHTDQLKPW